MKMKRLLAVLFTAVLLSLAAVLPAFAAETVASGTCNDDGTVTWTLTDDGVLTISGAGALGDQTNSSDDTDYLDYYDQIYSVVVEPGVTAIRANAFESCYYMQSVTLPEGLLSIGDEAFANCSSLKEVTIPASVIGVGQGAFAWCGSLTTVTVNGADTRLRGPLLGDADYGDEYETPTLTVQGYAGSRAQSYAAEQGYPFTALSGTAPEVSGEVVTVAEGTQGSSGYTMAWTVTSDGTLTFAPAEGEDAYHGAGFWESYRDGWGIYEPMLVTVVYDEGMYTYDLTTDMPYGMERLYLGSTATSGYRGSDMEHRWLESITVAEGNEDLWVEDGALYAKNSYDDTSELHLYARCAPATTLTVRADTSVIGLAAFACAKNLETIVLPEGLKTIETTAFAECTALKELTLPQSLTSLESNVFMGCTSLATMVIPESITTLENNLFYQCTGLKNVTLPSTVTKIPYYFFLGCTSLEQVVLPDTVTVIDREAFEGCTSLKTVNIPAGVTSIGSEAFNGCASLQNVTLPEGLTSLGASAFEGCASLTGMTVPAGITDLQGGTFSGCTALASVTLPDTLTSLGISEFQNCTSLEQIDLPAGVTSIGQQTFYGCTALKSLTLPEGVTTVAQQLCAYCTALESVTLPAGVTTIEYYAFQNCSSLQTIHLPQALTSIGRDAFAFCYSLESITVDEENTAYCAVDGVLFSKDQTTLVLYPAARPETAYTIPAQVTTLGRCAFQHLTHTSVLVVPLTVTNFGYNAIYACKYDWPLPYTPTLRHIFYEGTEAQWEEIEDTYLYGYPDETDAVQIPNVQLHYESTVVVIPGDADGSLEVTVADALALANHIAGKATLTGTAFTAVDLDENGRLDVTELAKLMNYITGKSSSLEMNAA